MSPQSPPETELERRLLDDPRLRAGLELGRVHGPGHPEGRVADHVAAMLAAIPSNDPLRGDLRFLALIHDSFKSEVRPHERWSPDNDHAALARRFAERYTFDERLLTTLELHDEPYWIWRTADAPEHALRRLLDRLPDRELFARFVELDAANEGKDLTFLWWFRRELAIAGRLPEHPRPPPTRDSRATSFTSRRSPPRRNNSSPSRAPPRARSPSSSQDAGRRRSSDQRRRTARGAALALARIAPRADRPRRRRRRAKRSQRIPSSRKRVPAEARIFHAARPR